MADFPGLHPIYLKFLLASFYLIRRLNQYGVDPFELVVQMVRAGAIDEYDAEVLRYHVRYWLAGV